MPLSTSRFVPHAAACKRTLVLSAAAVFAATTTASTFTFAQAAVPAAIVVNGASASVAQAERNNSIFVPAKSLFGKLGETVSDTSSQAVVKNKAGHQLAALTLGSRNASLNGTTRTLNAAPFRASDGVLMVPLRFVSEAAGAHVAYSSNPRTIDIRTAAAAAAAVVAAPVVAQAAPASQATDNAAAAVAAAPAAAQTTSGIPWWVWLLAALLIAGLLLAFLRRKKEPVIVTTSRVQDAEPTIVTRR